MAEKLNKEPVSRSHMKTLKCFRSLFTETIQLL